MEKTLESPFDRKEIKPVIAESKKELKVKEESKKVGLQFNIHKTKNMTSGLTTS